MSRIRSIWLKSLGMGLALGLAAWAMFYFFFLSHRELGVQPASAAWLGILGFAIGAVGSLIYFAMKAKQ